MKPSTHELALDATAAGEVGGAAPTFHPGDKVGEFQILNLLGAGAMGAVYAAYDPHLDRKVAIKVMRSDLFGAHVGSRNAQMLAEARALARLAHPNVVTVYAAGEARNQIFIAMEYVRGKNLSRWLTEHPRTWSEIVATLVAAGEGLAAAHARGLIHRDFKPDNVLVGKDGRIRVTDFGLARLDDEDGDSNSIVRPADMTLAELGEQARRNLTQTGFVMGTPEYMSPEQHVGRGVDARSDQFAFCVALYRALYGQKPFAGDTVGELCAATAGGELVPPPATSGVPARVQEAIARGLRPEPDDRFPDMDALLDVLRAAIAPPRHRGPWLLATAALVIAVAAATGLVLGRRSHTKTPGTICDGGGARIAEVWSPARRAKVQAAFAATKLPFAAKAFAAVAGTLDRYATRWHDAHQEACEATRVRHELSPAIMDLRMACLEQSRTQIATLVHELETPDRTTVIHAFDVGLRPSELAACSDIAALTSTVDLPQAAQAARVTRIRADLAVAQTMYRLGKFRESLALAAVVADASDATAYAPLQAEAHLLLGKARWREGKLAEAEDTLVTAAADAEAGRDVRTKVRAWIELVYVVGWELSNQSEAAHWKQLAEAGLRRMTASGPLRGKLLVNWGTALYRAGSTTEAIATFQEATRLFGDELNTDPYLAGQLASYFAVCYLAMGQPEQALSFGKRGLRLRTEALGDDHPDVAESLNNLANILAALGETAQAHDDYARALTIWKAALGPDHPRVAVALTNLAGLEASAGKPHDALALVEQALTIEERAFGPTHSSVGRTLANLGNLYTALDQRDVAESYYRRAATILEDSLGSDSPALAEVLTERGSNLLAQHNSRGAVVYLARARDIYEGRPELLAERGEAEFALARAQWEDRTFRKDALVAARRALEAYTAAGATHAQDRADVEAWLARHHD